MLSVLGPIQKRGGGGGGGGAACRTMIYILVCARVRDSAWGMERGGGGGGGGGGNWSQRAAFRTNGGGAAAPPPRAYAVSGADCKLVPSLVHGCLLPPIPEYMPPCRC